MRHHDIMVAVLFAHLCKKLIAHIARSVLEVCRDFGRSVRDTRDLCDCAIDAITQDARL